MLYAMNGDSIIQSNPTGWAAIHLGLVTAAHALANGQTDLVDIAEHALNCVEDAGYRSKPEGEGTRVTGSRITKWQTCLYAVNELPRRKVI